MNMPPVTIVGMTGLHAVRAISCTLETCGVTIVFDGRAAESRQWLEQL